MLIAIMGDTFDRVIENKQRFALMEKTQIYSDFIYAIQLSKTFEGRRYAYVVTPITEGDSDVWEGSISRIRSSLRQQSTFLADKVEQEAARTNHLLMSLAKDVRDLKANKS